MDTCRQCRCNCRQYCARCHCCSRCCCCSCCNHPCPPPPPVEASFTAVKRSATTGDPIPGAVFTLYQNGLPIALSASDAHGALSFSDLAPGEYRLVETTAPGGYQSDLQQHQVRVDAQGNVTIDGQIPYNFALYNVPASTLTFSKTDAATGLPLPGAGFSLSNGATVSSDSNGQVDFGTLQPGTYTLLEINTPAGYLPNQRQYTVTVSANNEITVNGLPIGSFSVPNQPNPELAFQKTDANNGQPLAGATFTLSNGATAVSDAAGRVSFGRLAPGTYTMTETAAPSGYEPNPTAYTVEVSADGGVTVNSTPLANFHVPNTPSPSPRPVINTVTEGDTTISGTGVAGAAIAVTLPDGSQVDTTVGANGIWSVTVPAGATLQTGQTVRANQTVPGSAASADASFVVQARP